MTLTHGLLAALVAACLPAAGRVHAQPPERYAVVITGEHPAAEFSLRDRNGATVVERCPEPCALTLPAGRLRLEMYDPEGVDLGARNVRVNRSAHWTAMPHDTVKRDVGLGLGVSGLVLLGVGSILWLPHANLFGHGGGDDSTSGDVGALLMLGGAIMTPIGLPLFLGNLRPKVAFKPLPAESY